MSGIYPSESPYVYAGNSPINFVDEGGLFKINAQFAKMYPTLTRMPKYYLPMLKDNPVVRDAFIRTTGMGGGDQMVNYGSGPWIVPTRYHLQNSRNYTDPAYGKDSQYKPDWAEENLCISGEKLNALERAFKAASISNNGRELGFQMFLTSVTIMHEGAHYGFFKKHGLKESNSVAASGRDIGAEFEGNAYRRFSYTNAGDAVDEEAMRKYYNLNSSNTGMFGMSLLPSLYGHNFNADFLRKYPVPKPNGGTGGGGDPHIKPDPHKN